ncbi:unnamed protein product, partial [Prorocentrum cordatum]
TQLEQGWLRREKCGATSYLGNHRGRIVAGVARKLAKPRLPPTAAGRRTIDDTQKGRLPNRGRKATPDEEYADGAAPEATSPISFRQGTGSEEVIELDAESSEPDVAQPEPQRRMHHPQSVVQASWRLVDRMEGYAEQWVTIVDHEVWDDMGDWMECCMPYLMAVTGAGGRAVSEAQERATTPQEYQQQLTDFRENIWRNTYRTRRRLMARTLALPRGTGQLAARVRKQAFLGKRGNIPAHSIPSRDRRPLPSTTDGYQAWMPENLDDVSAKVQNWNGQK